MSSGVGTQSMVPSVALISNRSESSAKSRTSSGRSGSFTSMVVRKGTRSLAIFRVGVIMMGASGTGETNTSRVGDRVLAPSRSVASRVMFTSPKRSYMGLTSSVLLPPGAHPILTWSQVSEISSTSNTRSPWSWSSVNAASRSRTVVQSESSSTLTTDGPTHLGGRLGMTPPSVV